MAAPSLMRGFAVTVLYSYISLLFFLNWLNQSTTDVALSYSVKKNTSTFLILQWSNI